MPCISTIKRNRFNSPLMRSFASGARFWIACGRWIGVPEICAAKHGFWRKLHKLRSELGRNPTEPELATEFGLDLRGLQLLLGEIDGLEVGSLRVESHLDGKEEDLCDSIPHDPQDTPLFLCLRGEMKQQLARAIAELPEKERQVLVLYYFQELTMKEVGAKLGVGESRVSQIHSTAVVRLRAVVILASGKPSVPLPSAAVNSAVRQERSLGQSAG